jgi:two-component system chemotaxis response regulator CheY
MSGKRILSVGQCGADHWSLETLLQRQFGAEVLGADTAADAKTQLRRGGIDLVLVNRVFDRDGSPGLDLIADLKGDAALAQVPVMLVSNHRDAQQQAMALGALPGFGKAALSAPATLEQLRAILA